MGARVCPPSPRFVGVMIPPGALTAHATQMQGPVHAHLCNSMGMHAPHVGIEWGAATSLHASEAGRGLWPHAVGRRRQVHHFGPELLLELLGRLARDTFALDCMQHGAKL